MKLSGSAVKYHGNYYHLVSLQSAHPILQVYHYCPLSDPDSLLTERPESKRNLTSRDIAIYQNSSYRGLLCLSHLHSLSPFTMNDDLVSILTCLASFTNLDDPWTNRANHEEACKLLAQLIVSVPNSEAESLVAKVLQDRVKPLFASSKSFKLTQQSRKSIDPLPAGASMSDENIEGKPWRFRDMYITTVLQWVLQQTIANPVSSS